MMRLYPQDTNASNPVARGSQDAGTNADISRLFRAVLGSYSNQALFAPLAVFGLR